MAHIFRRLPQWVFGITALVLAGHSEPAFAAIELNINRGNVQPLPIAVSNFDTEQPSAEKAGTDIAAVIRNNLERSGLFKPLDPRAHIQQPSAMRNVPPRFADWRVINAQALVTGRVDAMSDGRLRVEFRLWDVFAEQQLTGFAYSTTADNWRRIAHKVSDAIYKRITGEDGYFDTRVVFVAESGPRTARVKRLSIMDQDGENLRYLTDGKYLVLTPRFSPTQQEITYLSYFNNRPRVFLYNIDTGQQEVVGDFPGMTFAPRFAPNGNKVAMSLAQDGNSDIFAMDLRTRQIQRLTTDPGIDTAPSYAPDGKSIAFESDRSGKQQIYVMDADGGNQRRVSFGEGRYGTPVWSPRGDLIAFTKQNKGAFQIGVMRTDGSGERILSDAYHQEGPTWAPNGRVLMFFRENSGDAQGRGGRTRLWSVDLTGYNLREIITPVDASDPAWSPLSQ